MSQKKFPLSKLAMANITVDNEKSTIIFDGSGWRRWRAQGGQGEAPVTRSHKECLIVFYDLILLQPILNSDFDDLVILWNKCWKKKITGEKSIFFGLNCRISSYCIA